MITIKKNCNCTYFKVTEAVTAKEIISRLEQYFGGTRTDKALWDFTGTTKLSITPEEIKAIAEYLKSADDNKIRQVALVGSKTVNLGTGKLFTAFAQMVGLKNEYKAFRNMNHALAWLDAKAD
ncbi:MAG: STAS/SEC14 domain-containing protein [Desulfosarcina sp.]|jgi:hypothetical protein